MNTETNFYNVKPVVTDVSGRQSKTVRKFTGFFAQDALPSCISVHLDWLSFTTECFMLEPEKNQRPKPLKHELTLEYTNGGTPVYNHSFNLYQHGEPVAKLHTHPRNTKIMKEGRAKLEILNHVLYSSSLLQVIQDIMEACEIHRINNVSGLHIAIDGANHVHTFLNKYVRQNGNRSRPELRTLGRWDRQNRVRMKGKATLDCKRFDRKDGNYNNFKIGSTKKSFVVYNKTTELDRSHKEYIRESWKRAGLDPEQTQWRCELRLTSGSIKEIKNFDLNKITDPNYLLQIFKTQCKNFFEFVLIENDENISRARIIDLFQFEKLKVPLLEKIPRAIVRGAYKAQLSVHNAYANLMLGMYKEKESIEAAMRHITDNVELYCLDRWYEKKKPAWIESYKNEAVSAFEFSAS